ncbi:MAG: HAD-IA family hydrolase [Lachnospiraceae bacterium]|nr:HAD-IA family hydrolase [Lachnospiraceae bacterium]
MIRAVIFDLDDTLSPEKEYARSGYHAVADHLCRDFSGRVAGLGGIEAVFDRLWTLFEESPKMVFNRFLSGLGLPDDRETVMDLVKTYREHRPGIQYYEDVLPTWKILKELGLYMGILSDGYGVTQRRKIEALEAEKYFQPILLTDEIGREAWKPSIIGFRRIAEELGLSLSELVYVGDNPEKDFFISELAPIKTVRILRPDGVYWNSPYREGKREQFRIHSLMELKDCGVLELS